MTEVICTNCQTPLTLLFSTKNSKTNKKYDYLECNNCKLIRIFPIPPISKLYNFADPYSRFISQNPQADFVNKLPFGGILMKKYLDLFKNRVNYVENLKKGGKILDIGCSQGSFLTSFQADWKLFGLEINKNQAKIAQKKLPHAKIYTHKIETEKLPGNYFDVITLWHVLEHLKNPKLTLKIIYSALKPNGFLIIEVPNGHSLWRKIFRQNWQLLMPPEHLYFFSQKSLTQLLKKNGFKTKKVNYFGTLSPSAVSSLANYLRSKELNSNIAILVGIVLFPFIILINFLSFKSRENLMIIAQKRP